MKKETRIVLFLLFVSPMMAEMLSGTNPPLKFFNPFFFSLSVLLYGCGTILIREAKGRWHLQWSVIFLAVAYGIVEEGLMMKTFFNPEWKGLGVSSGYGMYLGIQWPWAIGLTFYHATVSTLIPIAVAEYLWPDFKNKPLLKKWGILLSSAGISFATLFGMIFFGTQQGGKQVPFYPKPLLMISAFAAVVLLIWLANKFSKSRISTLRMPLFPPVVFGILGFFAMAFIFIVPRKMAKGGAPAPSTLTAQLIFIALVILFVVFEIYHKRAARRHTVSLIFGVIFFWILLTPLHQFFRHASGMLIVGIVSLVLLLAWRRFVLKKSETSAIERQNGSGRDGGQ